MYDCHAHLALPDFDRDRTEVLRRARRAGVEKILVVAEDHADSLRVLEVCGRHPDMLLPCVGLHPDRFAEDEPAPPSREEIEAVCDLARQHRARLAAVGEVGLDYWRVKSKERRELQRGCLRRMAALAAELDLPLNVHARSAGRHAIGLLADCGARRVLMHAFDGKAGYAVEAARLFGWLFSIPPSVVRSRQKQKLARALPLEHLALESDSPVLGPDPSMRNEPANLAVTVRCLADLKQTHPAELLGIIDRNTRNILRAVPNSV